MPDTKGLPIHELMKEIREKSKWDIEFHEPFVAPSRTPIGQASLGVERNISNVSDLCSDYLVKYYEKVFGWIPANPSKEDITEAITEVYSETDIEQGDENNLVNTSTGYFKFDRLLKSDGKFLAYIVGTKGCGKTFYLNYYFNKETRNLYDINNVWYRAELSKLYRHNRSLVVSPIVSHTSPSKPYSVEDYLSLHVAYVTFKYRDHNEIFQNIFDDKDGIFSSMLINEYKLRATQIKDAHIPAAADIPSVFKQIIQQFEQMEKDKGVKLLSQHDIAFILNSSEISLMADLLGATILRYLLRMHFTPIIVLDGLENINYHDDYDLYIGTLNQVASMACNFDKVNRWNAKVVIAVRDETYQHMQMAIRNFHNKRQEHLFRFKSHDVNKIFEKKVSAALDPKSKLFKEEKAKAESDVRAFYEQKVPDPSWTSYIQTHHVSFRAFVETYCEQLVLSINSSLPDAVKQKYKPDLKFLYGVIYRGNLRAFLYNLIHIYEYYRLVEIDKKSIANRPYIITEGQLLNGNMYLNSEVRQSFYFGTVIPNIFYYPSANIVITWHGLCLLRTLQLCVGRGKVTRDELIAYLRNHFGYNELVLAQGISIALGHGLIQVEYSAQKTDSNDKALHFLITDKGLFLLDYSFSNINIFYNLALDTPLSDSAICNTKLVMVHENRPQYFAGYVRSCILTSLTLIRHINAQHSREMASCPESDKAMFRLPGFFPEALIDGIEAHLSSRRAMYPQSYKKIQADIQGIANLGQLEKSF